MGTPTVITVTHTADGGETMFDFTFKTCPDAAMHLLKLLTLEELHRFELFTIRRIKQEVAAKTKEPVTNER